MTTLTEFLRDRIAEDEAVARSVVSPAPWSVDGEDFERLLGSDGEWAGDSIVGNVDHIARWDPARVLAECEAKKRIVNEWLAFDNSSLRDAQPFKGLLTNMLCHLALPYADHPSWREEWRP